MKRKLTAMIAAMLVTAGLLGACQSSAAAPTAASEAAAHTPVSAEPQSLVLWHSMSDNAGVVMEKIVNDFNNGLGKEKGITVESVYQGTYTDSTTKMRAVLQNDLPEQLPDVMQIDSTGIVDYKSSKYAYTVDDAIKDSPGYNLGNISAAPLKAWNYDGRQLGMPFSSSTTVMYYNKTLLDAAGVMSPPTTFQDIISVHEKLPEKNSDGVALITYAQIPNSPTLTNWIGQMKRNGKDTSYVVDNRNGRDASATKLVCDTEGTLATFLTEWKRMYDSGALANRADGLNDLFLAGQLVFMTASTSQLNMLLTTIGGRFELGCTYYPRVSSDCNYGATVSGSAMFMFTKGSAAKNAAAWEFLQYLTSPEVQAEFCTQTGYFPIHQGAYDTTTYKDYVAKFPQMEVGIKQLNETSPELTSITVGPSRDFYYEMQNEISAMLDDGLSPQATVISMTKTLNGLLDQYNKANQK